MSNREMHLIPMGTVGRRTIVKGTYGGTSAATEDSKRDRKGAENETDAVHLRLLEELAKNRILGIELAWANDLIRAAAERKEAKKRVRRAALKLLAWLGVGFGCGTMTMACYFLAPRWTCVAPLVLTCLALWRAGGEV